MRAAPCILRSVSTVSPVVRRLSRHPVMRTSPRLTPDLDPEWSRSVLVECARLLAADFEAQRAALPDFVHVPDELLLEFDYAVSVAWAALEGGRITPEQHAQAVALNQACGAVVVPSDYAAALAAVRDGPEWAALRAQARALLAALGEDVRPPDLSHGTYVRGGPSDRHA